MSVVTLPVEVGYSRRLLVVADGTIIVSASFQRERVFGHDLDGHLVWERSHVPGTQYLARTYRGEQILAAGLDRAALVIDGTTGRTVACLPDTQRAWFSPFAAMWLRTDNGANSLDAAVQGDWGRARRRLAWDEELVGPAAFSPTGVCWASPSGIHCQELDGSPGPWPGPSATRDWVGVAVGNVCYVEDAAAFFWWYRPSWHGEEVLAKMSKHGLPTVVGKSRPMGAGATGVFAGLGSVAVGAAGEIFDLKRSVVRGRVDLATVPGA